MTVNRLELGLLSETLRKLGQLPCASDVLTAVGEALMSCTQAKGYTVFRQVPGTDEVERIHSSDPRAYPVGGRKRAADYAASAAKTAQGEVYIAGDAEEVRRVYRDAELIFSIGVTSIMNVPIRWGGQNIGAINLLGDAGQFGAGEAADAALLAALMVPAILSWDAEGAPR